MSSCAERIQVRAQEVQPGDRYIAGPEGREIGRTVEEVESYGLEAEEGRRTYLFCGDGSSPVLDPDEPVTVERLTQPKPNGASHGRE